MATELYRTQAIVLYKHRFQRTTFYFQVENTTDEHPFAVAHALNEAYAFTTLWLFVFKDLFSIHADFRQLRTRRIFPAYGPTAPREYAPGQIPGGLGGDVQTNFTLFTMHWRCPGEQTGKHQIRIGPIPGDRHTNVGWDTNLIFRASAFAGLHFAPVEVLPAITSRGAIKNNNLGGSIITKWDYSWPQSRQANRRLVF